MKAAARPSVCVWELTLACDARCVHCGSDAGRPRPRELDASEALALCDALAELGVHRVALSGGEPLRRPDWPAIARRLARGGVRVELISNGLALDAEVAAGLADCGVTGVTLSVDGPPEIHDELRGVPGAFDRLRRAAKALQGVGLPVGAATQVSTRNLPYLPALEAWLAEAGFGGWQIQLTDRLGRCEARPDLPLTPAAVPEVIRFVLAAADRGRLRVYAADNVGWMTAREPELRSQVRPTDRVFCGCRAGLSVLGIASDGTVRGCLSMPPAFDEGNVRDEPLARIWADPARFAYNRGFDEARLTGACAACAYRRVCRGGCLSQAWSVRRALGENPFCARLQEGLGRS
jgi:radical SAM protein with 4Fe4S-binding SPASM domain